MRAMALGGLVLEGMSPEERSAAGLPPSKLALRVKHVGQYGKHAAAKNAGFQKEDVIIEADGSSDDATEGELLGRLLRDRQMGERVKFGIWRKGGRSHLELPMQ